MHVSIRIGVAVGAVALAIGAGCGSKGDLNEACDRPGDPGECENGLVCGKPFDSAVAPLCLRACVGDKNCPEGTDCKGVEGTNVKGCRAK